jgi:DNA modification methylase
MEIKIIHYVQGNKNFNNSLEDYEMLGEVFSYSPFAVIHYPEEIYKIAFQTGYFPEEVISWVYNSNTAKQHRDIAFFGVKPDFSKVGQPYKNPKDKRVKKLIDQGKQARLYDWWNVNQVKNVSKDKTSHPCQMPLEVMERIIGLLPEEKIIVDPFMGSGTTGVACKKLGREFIGIEIDTDYCKLAEERINNAL